jgi:hypothetical protein
LFKKEAGADGHVVSTETFGPVVLLLREVITAGANALEAPLSKNLWRKAIEVGLCFQKCFFFFFFKKKKKSFLLGWRGFGSVFWSEHR